MSRRLGEYLLVAVCALLLAQQTSLGALLFANECTESCPDDVGPHRCPFGCAACGCVSHGGMIDIAAPVGLVERLGVACIEGEEPSMKPEPRPERVFHVPKAVVA